MSTSTRVARITRLASAVAMASVGATYVAPTVAQNAAPLLEEVIVTAQKREQSLQDVSMSLTAFTGAALEDRVIENLSDLQFSVPNLVSDSVRIAIRGVGNNAISSTAEGGLGFHVNGVYVNNPAFRSTEYFDVERIEVLLGPQGTLYGRNTTAGVINVITNKPTDEFEGHFTAGVGNYASQRLKGAINLPISDNLRQRFAASVLKRDGYDKNQYTGTSIDGRDSYEVRSSTSFDFSENTTADLVISYLNENSNRANETKGTCTKDPLTGCSALSAGFETPDVSGSIFQTLNGLFFGGQLNPLGDYFADAVNPPDFRRSNVDQEPTYDVEQLGVSLELSHDTDNYRFVSLTGYYDTEADVFQDFDRFSTDVRLNFPVTYRANARDFVTTDLIQSGRRDLTDSEQFTQEFRIHSDFDGDFNFLLGAFYYKEEQTRQVLITHPALAASQQLLGLSEDFELFNIESDPIETESLALFGEAYYAFSDQTRLTVGLRATQDEKNIRTRQQFLVLVNPAWIEAEDEWTELTGKVTLEHDFGDDSMGYVTFARGYKAGGLNPGGPMGGAAFDPEYINQFEVGTKNTLADGRVIANISAFYYDYEGLQIGQVSTTSAVTTNADADVLGAEAQFSWAATDALEFNVSASYLDFELNDFISADEGDPLGISPGFEQATDENGNPIFAPSGLPVKDLDGNAVRNAPELSFTLNAQYSFDVGNNLEATAGVLYFYQDEYWANEFNKPSDTIDSWDQTDLQFVVQPFSGEWSVKAFVKNVFDNQDIIRRGQDGPLVGRFRSVTVLEPRTYGLEWFMTF